MLPPRRLRWFILCPLYRAASDGGGSSVVSSGFRSVCCRTEVTLQAGHAGQEGPASACCITCTHCIAQRLQTCHEGPAQVCQPHRLPAVPRRERWRRQLRHDAGVLLQVPPHGGGPVRQKSVVQERRLRLGAQLPRGQHAVPAAQVKNVHIRFCQLSSTDINGWFSIMRHDLSACVPIYAQKPAGRPCGSKTLARLGLVGVHDR